jgi:hypothetical protein
MMLYELKVSVLGQPNVMDFRETEPFGAMNVGDYFVPGPAQPPSGPLKGRILKISHGTFRSPAPGSEPVWQTWIVVDPTA